MLPGTSLEMMEMVGREEAAAFEASCCVTRSGLLVSLWWYQSALFFFLFNWKNARGPITMHDVERIDRATRSYNPNTHHTNLKSMCSERGERMIEGIAVHRPPSTDPFRLWLNVR